MNKNVGLALFLVLIAGLGYYKFQADQDANRFKLTDRDKEQIAKDLGYVRDGDRIIRTKSEEPVGMMSMGNDDNRPGSKAARLIEETAGSGASSPDFEAMTINYDLATVKTFYSECANNIEQELINHGINAPTPEQVAEGKAMCGCTIRKIQTHLPFDEFKGYMKTLGETGQAPEPYLNVMRQSMDECDQQAS